MLQASSSDWSDAPKRKARAPPKKKAAAAQAPIKRAAVGKKKVNYVEDDSDQVWGYGSSTGSEAVTVVQWERW